jgi:hypothetical protein
MICSVAIFVAKTPTPFVAVRSARHAALKLGAAMSEPKNIEETIYRFDGGAKCARRFR